ncbi:CLUMA_CG018443, isoform A [Clunio marinus]|uniref:CLUMA_CG018443, isoform A n=1 Tax=Clunio marinus TaxID=568069 RepID=A0A1J1J0J3_9DIPT|nr:CLUMA_CG018443, isoform A [Clunio marinus]
MQNRSHFFQEIRSEIILKPVGAVRVHFRFKSYRLKIKSDFYSHIAYVLKSMGKLTIVNDELNVLT